RIAELVTREAGARIDDLFAMGAPFDKMADGTFSVSREAAHSCARVVHIGGDRAGPEVMKTLAAVAAGTPSVTLMQGFHAIELAVSDGRVIGLFARTGSGPATKLVLFRAPKVIFATGGVGALFAVTTNPPEVRGEGLGMAARAGALIGDPEFVQFHPTAIAGPNDPAPLATEALRGHGATLIDETGKRFMLGKYGRAELEPRDVVARAIHRHIAAGHKVFLDARQAIGDAFAEEFPTVFEACQAQGVDPAKEPIPVAPAAHYHMGGIITNEQGRSNLEGLWAVGECASTGLHGANRLASNSLLEGLVFGARVAADVRDKETVAVPASLPDAPERYQPAPLPQILRAGMSRLLGLERTGAGMTEALRLIYQVERASAFEASLLNVTAAAKLIAAGALTRKESRGSHFRSDYPQTEESATRTVLTLSLAEKIADAALAAGSENRHMR
ncbi:MAG: L-aspartate oxidase, partial [Rhizomicrobium sp.]